jgi:hypothetical protein
LVGFRVQPEGIKNRRDGVAGHIGQKVKVEPRQAPSRRKSSIGRNDQRREFLSAKFTGLRG